MQMGPYVLPALSEQIHGTCLGSWVGIKVTGRQKQTLYHTFVLKVGFVPEVTAILWGFFGGEDPTITSENKNVASCQGCMATARPWVLYLSAICWSSTMSLTDGSCTVYIFTLILNVTQSNRDVDRYRVESKCSHCFLNWLTQNSNSVPVKMKKFKYPLFKVEKCTTPHYCKSS